MARRRPDAAHVGRVTRARSGSRARPPWRRGPRALRRDARVVQLRARDAGGLVHRRAAVMGPARPLGRHRRHGPLRLHLAVRRRSRPFRPRRRPRDRPPHPAPLVIVHLALAVPAAALVTLIWHRPPGEAQPKPPSTPTRRGGATEAAVNPDPALRRSRSRGQPRPGAEAQPKPPNATPPPGEAQPSSGERDAQTMRAPTPPAERQATTCRSPPEQACEGMRRRKCGGPGRI
jgi:hypothetical protein